MSAMLLNELSSPVSSSPEMVAKSKSVLRFLAESVNIYNWYLRRSENPRRRMYDESEKVAKQLFEELYKRAKEDPEVSIKLKEAVSAWKLDAVEGMYDADVLEEEFEREYDGDVDNLNSKLWSNFIQHRQDDLHYDRVSGTDMAHENFLWEYLDGTPDAPEIYVRLRMLEQDYSEVLSNDYYNSNAVEMTLSERLYNYSFGEENDVNLVPPAFGAVNVELECIYLNNHSDVPQGDYYDDDEAFYLRGDGEYYEPEEEVVDRMSLLRVVDKEMVLEFDCPICFEEQTSGASGVSTMCGHSYCSPCFSGMVSRKAECGMCRAVIVEYSELTVV